MKVKAPTSVVGISCDFFTPKKRAFCEFLGHVYWKSSGNGPNGCGYIIRQRSQRINTPSSSVSLTKRADFEIFCLMDCPTATLQGVKQCRENHSMMQWHHCVFFARPLRFFFSDQNACSPAWGKLLKDDINYWWKGMNGDLMLIHTLIVLYVCVCCTLSTKVGTVSLDISTRRTFASELSTNDCYNWIFSFPVLHPTGWHRICQQCPSTKTLLLLGRVTGHEQIKRRTVQWDVGFLTELLAFARLAKAVCCRQLQKYCRRLNKLMGKMHINVCHSLTICVAIYPLPFVFPTFGTIEILSISYFF